MDERFLLGLSLLTAAAGLAALFALSPLPDPTVRGYVEWSNGTHARLSVSETVWVSLQDGQALREGWCVNVSGERVGDEVSNALVLQTALPDRHRCP